VPAFLRQVFHVGLCVSLLPFLCPVRFPFRGRAGAQCSCGAWVVPGLQIPKSKVDASVVRIGGLAQAQASEEKDEELKEQVKATSRSATATAATAAESSPASTTATSASAAAAARDTPAAAPAIATSAAGTVVVGANFRRKAYVPLAARAASAAKPATSSGSAAAGATHP
jgi:hypothetical protein